MDLLTTPAGARDLQLLVAVAMAGLLGALAFLTPDRRRGLGDVRERPGQILAGVLLIVAVLSATSYFYGSRAGGSWMHRWDLYHTVISAKYFDELGYDRLYECTWVIDREGPRRLPELERMRDLETLEYGSPAEIARDSDCLERFTPERRREFERDIGVFDDLGARWHDMLLDKGYNGTPFYTAIAGTVFDAVPLTQTVLRSLALIDVVLVIAGFVIVGVVFGPITGLVAAIFLFANFPARFTHMGGSFLRYDYLVALLLGLAALRVRRHATAGGLLAYATMVRAFPAFFAMGYGAKALYGWVAQARSPRPLGRFVAGFGAVAAIAVLVSLGAGGLDAWRAWAEDLAVHSRNTAGFRIGFKHLFMFEGNLYGTEGFVGFAEKTENLLPRYEWFVAGIGLMVLPLILVWRRLDGVTAAAALGTLVFFVELTSTRYYYAVLVALLLLGWRIIDDRGYTLLAAGLFLVSASGYLALRNNTFDPWLYNTVQSYAITAWFIAFGVWLLVAAPSLEREPPAATEGEAEFADRAPPEVRSGDRERM